MESMMLIWDQGLGLRSGVVGLELELVVFARSGLEILSAVSGSEWDQP